ncbi:MAG: Na+/H+ antiporter NhaC [Bacteroidetes bacterium]|nr:MAG: Na+/H+ antiporter NhaC [Bacteroidota bacterium]
MKKAKRKASLLEALLPVIFLIILLGINVMIYGDNSLGGANQITLLLAAAVAAIVAVRLGYSWHELFGGAVSSIKSALPAIVILLLIGSLAGTWLISGIVPAMVYYGLKILSPSIFLFAACAVSAIVSLATGSSWSTIATVGIALLGIGQALGWSTGIIAGAIISGAYFGDKMSPLSDTTTLAPAVAGTDLFTHIRYMTITTVPSISITLILFLIIGFSSSGGGDLSGIDPLMSSIESSFNINLLLFLVPVVVIWLIVKKMPAIPALFIGTLLGGLFAVIFQPETVKQLAGIQDNYLRASYVAVTNAMANSTSLATDNEIVNNLLTAKGMEGMLSTIWLIVCAMIFGGIMEGGKLLERITESLMKLAKTTGSLIATTAGTCLVFNATASDQYLAIVVPGRMFAKNYEQKGLAPQNLSRTLEDSGTVTSVLVPWNTCGAVQSSVLGVATLTYLPFCFFNILSPIMTVIVGFAGYKIAKLTQQSTVEVEATAGQNA